MVLTRKKALQFSLDFDYYKKLLFLGNVLKRKNESDLIRFIVESYIDDYEKKHGEIKTETPS